MGNMSYCRFVNTLKDLTDCYCYLWESLPSSSEEKARKDLIAMCIKIANEYGDEEGEEDSDEE